MSDFASVMKDRAIFFGWIVGLTLAALLLWSLTFSFRANLLMRSANRALAEAQDTRRLSSPLPYVPGQFSIGGWYAIEESDSLFFVFAIFRDGILVPCGAEISPEGRVTEIVPLGNHARQVWYRIPQGVINVHLRRIEAAAAQIVMRYSAAGGEG